MLNATDSSDVTFYGMRDLVDVKMDFTLHAVDKLTLVVCFFAILTDGAVFATLGKLPQVKNYCPVRLLQILAVYQIIWGILQGVEDPKLRPLDSMVPDFVPRDVACKIHSIWNLPTTILWQNLLISTDKFVAIFFPIWYKHNTKASLAYISSLLAALNVFLAIYVPVGLGWSKLPVASEDGLGCIMDVSDDDVMHQGVAYFMVLYTAILPLSVNCAMMLAGFISRKRAGIASQSSGQVSMDRVVLKIASITSASFVCFTFIFYVVYAAANGTLFPVSLHTKYLLYKLGRMCLVIRGGINFILYVKWSPKFRQVFLSFFAKSTENKKDNPP